MRPLRRALVLSSLCVALVANVGDSRVSPNDTGLVVVDVEEGPVEDVRPDEISEELPKILSLIDAARRAHVPIAVIEYEGAYGNVIPAITEVLSGYDRVAWLSKDGMDGFTNPDLEPFLRAYGVRRVGVVGGFEYGCAGMTMRGAEDHGFLPVTSMDTVLSARTTPRDGVKYLFEEHSDLKSDYRALIVSLTRR